MAFSSPQNNHNAFNLNVVPSAEPEVWRPYFLSPNVLVTVIDSAMLSGTTATIVVAGFLTSEDGKVLAGRIDPQTINDSMALTIQCVAFVSNMGRRLHVRNHEVRALRSQVTILQRLLKNNKKKLLELK
jgi:chaperonin GroEL (HSP60 family)